MTDLTEGSLLYGEAQARPTPHSRLRGVLASLVPPVIFCVALAAAWEGAAVHNPSPLLPRLAEIAGAVVEITRSGDAMVQIAITLGRIAIGFALAFVIALVIGFASARHRGLERFFEPALVLGLTVPGLVWALLCVIWFGLSLKTSAIAIALGVAPALALSVTHGLRAVDPQLIEVARVFRFPASMRLRRLWLPALLPFLLSGTRLGISLAWKVVVLVEIFGLSNGVGYRLNSAFSAQNVADVLAWTVVFAVVMASIEYGIMQGLERRLTRWRRTARA